MKKIVLCFDDARMHAAGPGTTVDTLARLLGGNSGQIVWHHRGIAAAAAPLRRRSVADQARTAVGAGYRLLARCWQPGDTIYLFGAGRGAYCAQDLARLLGTIGVIDSRSDLLDYAVAAYSLPRTRRSERDWRGVSRLAARLAGTHRAGVGVRFLGLWDTAALPGVQRGAPLTNVDAGRHAIAIDGGTLPDRLVGAVGGTVEDVWFRGTRRDVTGGEGACAALADIAFDWVLDGALDAGLALGERGTQAPAPTELDALAGAVRAVSLRRPPAGALVHSSVEMYVHAHPQYWRRLPARVVWVDPDWLARGERLITLPGPAAQRAWPAAPLTATA